MPRSKETFEAMREATRHKIESAALALFARKGLSVTVDDIARAAGLSKGMLYNHYPSKEALVAKLAGQAVAISGQSIKALAQSSASATEKIGQISELMCTMLCNSSFGIESFMFMLQVDMSGYKLPEEIYYSAGCPNPIESLAQIIAQGQAQGLVVNGDPTNLSTVYWAVIQGLCCYAITGIALSPEPEMLNRILLKESLA